MPSVETVYPRPMVQSGSLDEFEQIFSSPALGLEFPNIDLVEVTERPNSDEILRDLAVLIAERGVVMFRNQTRLTSDKHRDLVDRIAALGGRPKENGIMKHALASIYGDHPEMQSLTPERVMMRYGLDAVSAAKRQNHAAEWHRDMAFEPDPCALTSLRLEQLPLVGGDTMYASSYELYDRMSKPFQQLLESLTGTWQDDGSGGKASKPGVYTGPRGSPKNVGFGQPQVHPIVRTHPVTGFKALYAGGLSFKHFNDVTPEESKMLLDMVNRLLTQNHDIQIRMNWRSPGDMCIWDNRCVVHTATHDAVGKRLGFRCLSAGETPYLDPNSMGRADARRTLKVKYDEAMEKVKKANLDVKAEYENGKMINGNGHFGANVVSLKELVTALDA